MPSPSLRRRVDAVPGQPLPHGILGAGVTIIDVPPDGDRVHELLGVDWLPVSCCDAHCWADPCDLDQSPAESPGESPGEPRRKIFCEPQWHTAPPVTVYAAVQCAQMGFAYTEAVAQATTALMLGAQRAVEQFVWNEIITGRGVDRTPAGGPVSFPMAVGILEGWLATTYGGLGVVHVPAAGGPLMANHRQLRTEGARLRTWSGHNVILGAGYQVNTGPGGVPAPPGAVWLAATGPVVVRREAAQVVPGTSEESLRIETNDRLVLAERTFVVQVSCAVEMVLASLGCCC